MGNFILKFATSIKPIGPNEPVKRKNSSNPNYEIGKFYNSSKVDLSDSGWEKVVPVLMSPHEYCVVGDYFFNNSTGKIKIYSEIEASKALEVNKVVGFPKKFDAKDIDFVHDGAGEDNSKYYFWKED